MNTLEGPGRFFVPVGTPIEKCPVCDARVCRVIVERSGSKAKWKLASVPFPFSLDGEHCSEHLCRGALEYLQNPAVPIKPKTDENPVERIERTCALDISNCCEAPIDYSQVITSGRYKNHGPRFCSKCKKCLYQV